MGAKKKNKKWVKIVAVIVLLLIGSSGFYFYSIYEKIYKPNVILPDHLNPNFYIKTGSSLEEVVNNLHKQGFILNKVSFSWLSERKNYKGKNIHAGRYIIKAGMSNNELINMLRSGEQVPIPLVFNSVRTKAQLAGKVASQLECDSLSIIVLLDDDRFMSQFDLSSENALSLFIPNTYEFYWNTSAQKFIEKMGNEHIKFWNSERLRKAKEIRLSKVEVVVLASIVQAEQSVHNDEKAEIAGLYINRLNKGMKLESDPTLVYAHGDFSISRVYFEHKEIDSPYNTYKYTGLPPGPINLPEVTSIDAVLNYKRNSFLFMCAKEDFSGYHNFSINFDQHLICANKYRAALNRKKIK